MRSGLGEILKRTAVRSQRRNIVRSSIHFGKWRERCDALGVIMLLKFFFVTKRFLGPSSLTALLACGIHERVMRAIRTAFSILNESPFPSVDFFGFWAAQ